MTLLRIRERVAGPTRAALTLTLSFEQRQKSRQRVRLDSGEEAGLDLPRGTLLRGGDGLRAEDGRMIEIRAAAEPVTTAYSGEPRLLCRAAYHLGNRHVALEIGDGWVRYLADHVLDAMVAALGLRAVHEQAAFEPEGGAYPGSAPGGHGHE